MAQINIVIVDTNGKEQKFELPNDKPIERMFLKLSQGIGLVGPISSFIFMCNSQILDTSKSFQQLEIEEGAIIRLQNIEANPTHKNTLPGTSGISSTADYYLAKANGKWPALIIFLIDASGSMGSQLGSETRIKVVENTFKQMIKMMIRRSMRGNFVSPKYKLALITYSDRVDDVYGGIRTISEVANIGYPKLHASNVTNSRDAFIAARELLKVEIPKLQGGIAGSEDNAYPAPLVFHLTDGFYTEKFGDPESIVDEIKRMSVPDGHVLVENIFILEDLNNMPLDPEGWGGFLPKTKFPGNNYAEKLLAMSSTVPESYRIEMAKSGYQINSGTVMFYPGTSPELVKMAFQMSIATPTGDNK